MQKLPVKSTERENNKNSKLNKEKIEIPQVKSKAKKVLKVILILITITIGLVIFVTICFSLFSSSNENEKTYTPNQLLYVKPKKVTSNNNISYICKNILSNCKECEEITIQNSSNLTINQTNNTILSSIVCTSCDTGYYPIYNEENIILFCNKKCEIGDFEFCKNCNSENQNQCGECNNGFYLPVDDMIKSKCKKCDLIENCEECYGTKNSIICKKCNNNYFLSKKKNICEPLCEIGENNYCKTCDQENNECSTCNPGYYLPNDEEDKSKCKKCSTINDKCEECYGTKESVKCLSCKNGYIPFYNNKNEIIECNPICETGINDYCKECNYEKNQCSSCNEGYYLPNDDLYKLKCKKCSDIVKNCNKCNGELNSVTCEDFILDNNNNNNNQNNKCIFKCETGPNEKCLTCDRNKDICNSCNIGYYLPTDSETKLECKKCSLENCQTCEGTTTSNICTSCINSYSPILSNGIITECKLSFQISPEDKEKLCSEFCIKN